MSGTKNRNIKILGAGWLALGGIFLAIALLAIGQFIVDPSAAEAEEGLIGGLVFVLVLVVVGSLPTVNGLALLRRHPIARPVLAVSSLVFLIPSALGVVVGIGIPFLVVVVASLWLTLSTGGKEALEGYMERANG